MTNNNNTQEYLTYILQNKNETNQEKKPINIKKEDEWAIEPEKIIRKDVPTNDEIDQQEIEYSLNELLAPSKAILESIKIYLKENNVSFVAITTECKEQSFTIENKKYVFHENDPISENHLKNIYLIILDMKNQATLKHIINKRPNTLKILEELMFKNNKKFKHNLLNKFEYKQLCKLITRALSFTVNHAIKESKSNNFIFKQNTLLENLGDVILEGFVLLNYIYDTSFTESEIEDTKNKVQEFPKLDVESIQKLIKDLSISTYSDSIVSETDINLKDALKLGLQEYLIKNAQVLHESSNIVQEMESKLGIIKREIGSEIVTWLEEIGLLSSSVIANVPHTRFVNTHINDLLAGSSFFKPTITLKNISTVYTINKGDLELNLDLDKNPIPNKKEVHIYAKEKLTIALNEAEKIQHSVNVEEYLELLQIILKSFSALKSSINNEDVQNILLSLYDIDFSLPLKNNTDNALVLELIEYALNILQPHDVDFFDRCENNLACLDIYNKVTAYKHFIRGMINDLNLYQHFNFFYMPKYVTSTGRVYNKAYFLSFQGIKIVRAFVTFKESNNRIKNNEDLLKVNEIFKKVFPTINEAYFFTDINQYNRHIRGLYNTYVNSFCKNNIKINEYPKNGDILNKLNWLKSNVRKTKYLLYIKALIEAGYSNAYKFHIYEKDATSNGLQLIGLLMRDFIFCKDVNIVGNIATDKYNDYLQDFKTINDIRKNTLQDFFQIILNTTLENEEKVNSLFIKLLTSNDFSKAYSNYKEKLTDEQKEKIIKYHFPAISGTLPFSFTEKTDKVFRVLFKVKNIYNDMKLFNKVPKEVLTRNLFKKAVMALGYGQGDNSRIDDFKTFIKKSFSEEGYASITMTPEEFDSIAQFINRFFNVKTKMELRTSKEFLNITQSFAANEVELKDHIKIETPFLIWCLRMFKNKMSRHLIKTGKKETRFAIYHNYGKDKEEMQQTFPSIFIQGLDAFIVHQFFYSLNKLNKLLEENGLPKVEIMTLHDCYGIIVIYAHFLEPIMQEVFNNINTLTFPGMPLLNSILKEAVKCTSSHFIKH